MAQSGAHAVFNFPVFLCATEEQYKIRPWLWAEKIARNRNHNTATEIIQHDLIRSPFELLRHYGILLNIVGAWSKHNSQFSQYEYLDDFVDSAKWAAKEGYVLSATRFFGGNIDEAREFSEKIHMKSMMLPYFLSCFALNPDAKLVCCKQEKIGHTAYLEDMLPEKHPFASMSWSNVGPVISDTRKKGKVKSKEKLKLWLIHEKMELVVVIELGKTAYFSIGDQSATSFTDGGFSSSTKLLLKNGKEKLEESRSDSPIFTFFKVYKVEIEFIPNDVSLNHVRCTKYWNPNDLNHLCSKSWNNRPEGKNVTILQQCFLFSGCYDDLKIDVKEMKDDDISDEELSTIFSVAGSNVQDNIYAMHQLDPDNEFDESDLLIYSCINDHQVFISIRERSSTWRARFFLSDGFDTTTFSYAEKIKRKDWPGSVPRLLFNIVQSYRHAESGSKLYSWTNVRRRISYSPFNILQDSQKDAEGVSKAINRFCSQCSQVRCLLVGRYLDVEFRSNGTWYSNGYKTSSKKLECCEKHGRPI